MVLKVQFPVTMKNFDEKRYLDANPDVRAAVEGGSFRSARHHFEDFGHKEVRYIRDPTGIESLRRAKMEKVHSILRKDMEHIVQNDVYNYLTDELRSLAKIKDTSLVSAHPYDENIVEIIGEFEEGLVLDCGSGRRDVYYQNVINFEIVEYDTTDVLGVGEVLPFRDNSLDAVISIAVLEHVRDPFMCAREIIRVLKPGGVLYCSVPLLQPLHGYPHHYYNMTHQGLANLFDAGIDIKRQDVMPHTGPIWSLTWIVSRWLAQLPPNAAAEMRNLKLSELERPASAFLDASWVQDLPTDGQMELASATFLYGVKK